MKLLPIDTNEPQNIHFTKDAECKAICTATIDFYTKVGFNKPWIGYFAVNNENVIIGCGGFKGKPKDGKIELSYSTFKKYEGQGIGTEICRQLVLLSLNTDPAIRITARTIGENNASTNILKRNGFECTGIVNDEEDGAVWEW